MAGVVVLVPSRYERHRVAVPSGVEVATCGVGVVASALATAERLGRGAVDGVLLVGLAGTRDPARAPVGALVVGTAVVNEAVGAGHGRGFVGAHELPFDSDDAPLDVLALLDLPLARAVHGAIGTVGAASADASEAAAWRERHPDVLVEEMEGHAVAAACNRHDVPLAILRAVSNVCGDRVRERWDVEGACAALDEALPPAVAALRALATRR